MLRRVLAAESGAMTMGIRRCSILNPLGANMEVLNGSEQREARLPWVEPGFRHKAAYPPLTCHEPVAISVGTRGADRAWRRRGCQYHCVRLSEGPAGIWVEDGADRGRR